MKTKQLPHKHIERELTFPFTCPLCHEVFGEDMKAVCQFNASDMPRDEWAIHVHVISFFSCVPCGRRYTEEGEEHMQARLFMLMETSIPRNCECRSSAKVGDLIVSRN